MFANDGCGSDNNAGAVVDGEIVPYGGAWMDVDAGLRMSHLGNHAGNHGDTQFQQAVGNAVVADGPEAWVAINHFFKAAGGRTSEEGGFHVGGQLFPDSW